MSFNKCQFKDVAGLRLQLINPSRQSAVRQPALRSPHPVPWSSVHLFPKWFQVSTSIDMQGLNRQCYK